jgi:hypothetical protein
MGTNMGMNTMNAINMQGGMIVQDGGLGKDDDEQIYKMMLE